MFVSLTFYMRYMKKYSSRRNCGGGCSKQYSSCSACHNNRRTGICKWMESYLKPRYSIPDRSFSALQSGNKICFCAESQLGEMQRFENVWLIDQSSHSSVAEKVDPTLLAFFASICWLQSPVQKGHQLYCCECTFPKSSADPVWDGIPHKQITLDYPRLYGYDWTPCPRDSSSSPKSWTTAFSSLLIALLSSHF